VNEEIKSRDREISRVAKEAKATGLSRRERRDTVITSLAKPDIRDESPEVKKRAINKYWAVIDGALDKPVLIVAPHGKSPGRGELISLVCEKYSNISYEEAERLVTGWLSQDEEVLKENQEILAIIKRIADRWDEQTDRIAQEIGRRVGATTAVAKKSRMWADLNRRSFFHKPRGSGEGESFVQTKEYPTSARASWYWLVEKEQEKTVGLNEDGEVQRPFLQLSIHGAGNRITEGEDGCDFVIGGGDARGGKMRLADQKVIEWFSASLAEKIFNRRLEIQEGLPINQASRVAIDKKGGNLTLFEFDEKGQLARRQRGKGFALSGAWLGLEYFRGGRDFQVETADGSHRLEIIRIWS